ncbi:hypothetical protein [Halococcus agarilyticus]|uniref:hypothetical protein n=1 Tax=Halococcus agarilyticus TaxID=1232219 RepID=UPI0006777C04|nr:hypothetical protein [Halococcus agarilyticus]
MASDDEVKAEVRNLILNHQGAANPISSRQINDDIEVDDIGSFPNTRSIVRELIFEEGLPIASGSNGYYLIETEAELVGYTESLESRVLNITDRKAAVIRAARGWQGEIEPDDDSDLLGK